MSLDREENIEISNAVYNKDIDTAKLYVLNVDQEKDYVWVMTGKDLDSLVNQFTGSSFSFNKDQREIIILSLIGKKFKNKVKVDMKNLSKDDYKDGEKVASFHNVFDKYPFGQISYEERRKELEE
ncbi:MAG: hypothetical protein J7L15_00745 [Clostridiales bacterium]|nr:hypothetical protein [Clostridiales bacterium]